MRSTKLKPVTHNGPVPLDVIQAPVYKKKRIPKSQMVSFTDAMLLLHVPEGHRLYFRGIFKAMENGEKWAYEQWAEMHNLIKSKGFNVNLTQQLLNQSVAAGAEAPIKGCDAFIRELAEKRSMALPPAPPTIEIEPDGRP